MKKPKKVNKPRNPEAIEKLIAKIDNNEKLTFAERNIMNIEYKRAKKQPA